MTLFEFGTFGRKPRLPTSVVDEVREPRPTLTFAAGVAEVPEPEAPEDEPDDEPEPDEDESIVDVPGEAAALDEVIAFAERPLLEERTALDTMLAALTQPREKPQDRMALTAKSVEALLASDPLTRLMEARERTIDVARQVLAQEHGHQQAVETNAVTAAALETLREFAMRPPPEAPDVHVHVPKHDLNVHVDAPTFTPQIDVHVPEQKPQPAPVVNVAAAEAPVVNVNVPDQKIDVHIPAQETPHVHLHVPESVPARPSSVRVEFDEEGKKRFVPEYDTDTEGDDHQP